MNTTEKVQFFKMLDSVLIRNRSLVAAFLTQEKAMLLLEHVVPVKTILLLRATKDVLEVLNAMSSELLPLFKGISEVTSLIEVYIFEDALQSLLSFQKGLSL